MYNVFLLTLGKIISFLSYFHSRTHQHTHTAEFLTSIARHDEACSSRVRAAELSPNNYNLVMAAATSLRWRDRKEEAEKWYRQVSKKNKKLFFTHSHNFIL